MRRAQPVSIVIALASLIAGFDWPSSSSRVRDELANASARERIDLVRRLATFDDETARDALLGALNDADPNVRRQAVDAVAVAKIDEARDRLLALLSDADPALRRASALALGKLRLDVARAPLTRALADADPRVRAAAVTALSALPAPRDLTVLITALDDSDTEVRAETVRALGRENDPRVVSALLGRTRDQAPEVRIATLEALATRSDPRVRGALFAALDDTSDNVVLEAIKGLRRDPRADAESALRALRESERPRVRKAADDALSGLSGHTRSNDAKARAPWLNALEKTARAEVPDADALVAELEATLPPGEARAALPLATYYAKAPKHLHARILGLLYGSPNKLVADTVASALKSEDGQTRIAALHAVARLGITGLDEALVQALDERDPKARRAATAAIEKVGGPSAARVLIARVLADSGEHGNEFFYALASALRRSQKELLDDERTALRAALLTRARGEEQSASAATACLGALGDDESVQALITLSPSLSLGDRVAIVRALRVAQSSTAIAILRAWIVNEPAPVAAAAIAALGELGAESDVARLMDAAKKGPWPLGPVTAYALATLVERGKAAPDVLCELTRSQEPITRRNAYATLARLPTKACGEVSAALLTTGVQDREGVRPANTWTALVRDDGRTLITYPDSSGETHWPEFVETRRESAWAEPYGH